MRAENGLNASLVAIAVLLQKIINAPFHLQVHTRIEDALKYLDPKIMPKEYGGVMPMAEMIGKVIC
jgi:hypothetical protein